ncbi:hypothetical protein X738_30340 [Mesorhizobium sp. LNHC209A00]|nr:hypothetical protein X738_30340 [Mesorhizobium sp. LNHC209A00]
MATSMVRACSQKLLAARTEVADKLLWLIEAGHVANRGLHRQRDPHVCTGDGHQPLHAVILKI